MHCPIRTRRLLITAILSALAFLVIAAAGVRSFWTVNLWDLGPWSQGPPNITLDRGCVIYHHMSSVAATQRSDLRKMGYISGDLANMAPAHRNILVLSETKFVAAILNNCSLVVLDIDVPLWFPLLLLIIPPIRWLIARPANAPAFPVITKQP